MRRPATALFAALALAACNHGTGTAEDGGSGALDGAISDGGGGEDLASGGTDGAAGTITTAAFTVTVLHSQGMGQSVAAGRIANGGTLAALSLDQTGCTFYNGSEPAKPEPGTSVDEGPVTLAGLGGGPYTLKYTTTSSGSGYAIDGDTQKRLPESAFQSDTDYTLSSTTTTPPFSVTMHQPAALAPTSSFMGSPFGTIDRSQDAVVTWTPAPSSAGQTIVGVVVASLQQSMSPDAGTGSGQAVVCYFADGAGKGTVPKAMLGMLQPSPTGVYTISRSVAKRFPFGGTTDAGRLMILENYAGFAQVQ